MTTTQILTQVATKKYPAYINWLIKIAVVALFLALLYHQIFAKENIREIGEVFKKHFNAANIGWLLATVLLMPVNWLLETMKWRQLIAKVEEIPFWKSYKAVIAGVSLSLFTPNRIGEYGGRILFVSPENQMKTVIATLVGTFSQLLVLLSVGYMGLIFFIHRFWQMNGYFLKGIFSVSLMFIGLMLFCYFNIDLVAKIAKRVNVARKLSRFVKHVKVLKSYSKPELANVLSLSLMRYMVYTTQYFLLLHFFGINVSVPEGLACIATVFLLQTSIPLDPVTGFFARGEVALVTWRLFGASDISIIASSFGLWIINLIIPAFIGIIFIVNLNILKSLGYGKTTD